MKLTIYLIAVADSHILSSQLDTSNYLWKYIVYGFPVTQLALSWDIHMQASLSIQWIRR